MFCRWSETRRRHLKVKGGACERSVGLTYSGKNGGALYKVADNKFIYQGCPSTSISFVIENEKVISLTVTEPAVILTAKKI